jgi:hypothetical protein
MIIKIERSGGFAGITKTITVDTEKLPKDIANRIEKHMTQTKLPSRLSRRMKTSMADCYYYKISTKPTAKKKEIEFGEFEVDKELRATVNFLFQKFNTNA